MQQLVGLSLALGQRTACAFDVGAGPRMATVEKQHAGPDVHRLFVAPGEVVIESREQELLDTRIAIANGTWVERRRFRRCVRDRTSVQGTTLAPGKGHGPDYSAVPERPAPVRRSRHGCGKRAPMAIIESIPNISEGRRADLIDAIANAVAATPGVRLLDRSSDASHNRTVLTLAGPPRPCARRS